MSTITQQFSDSPRNNEFLQFSVSVSGSVTALVTGTSSWGGLWMLKVNGANTGKIFFSSESDGSPRMTFDAGDIVSFIPGTLQGLYYHGDVVNDGFSIWRKK
jgi:hypothetical protein